MKIACKGDRKCIDDAQLTNVGVCTGAIITDVFLDELLLLFVLPLGNSLALRKWRIECDLSGKWN